MVKYLYKTVVLMAVFAASLFFFGSRLESDTYEEGTVVQQGEETFPYLTLTTQDITVNRLYGYTGPIADDIVRESITPLNEERKIRVRISDAPLRLIKMAYEVVDKENGEVYYSGEVNALTEETKEIELFLDYGFQTSTEYILSVTATTSKGRKIHYYTRIKYYAASSYLQEKLNFAMQFHEDTFTKSNMEKISRYLEPDASAANDTLSLVNIKSDSDLVTWGNLAPEKITKIVPTIKEYNMETACFQLNYFVEAQTGSAKEIYEVNEFYRVRYASGNSYLLNFERTMEAEFDPELTSVKKSQLKIGITNDTDMQLMENQETNQLFFAREGNLYSYRMMENQITKIYSAYSEKASYVYRESEGQEIRLLRTDSEGNLYFAVCGYFPRGQYEGKVAIVLYQYAGKEGTLNELVYLPIDSTYQQLKEDFSDYGYVSERNVYYFTVANVVYSYNMQARRLTKIAENVTDMGFKVMEESQCFVWSDSLDKGYGETITILNLETEEKVVIPKLADGEFIRLLGTINGDVIYGYVRQADITQTSAGHPVIPCYKIVIANSSGEESKVYARKNKYVTDVRIEGNVMTMSRVKKVGKKKYRKVSNDSILNQTEKKEAVYTMKSRVSAETLTEWYIGFPSGFQMETIPSYEVAEDSVVTGGRSVHLDSVKVPKYYVYALGRITGAYEDPAEAIRQADEQMGVVVSGSHMVVWERSGSFLMNSIAGLQMKRTSENVSNLAACATMVLKANHVSVNPEKLSAKSLSLYQMLEQYMEEPVTLQGVTLEQVLYFVSNNRYVIGMTSNSTAVVISGYDTKSVTLYNPNTGKVENLRRSEAERLFEQGKNRFISYLN